MTAPTQLDLQRAREITHLYGGNGLSTLQSERLVAEKLAEWREMISEEDQRLLDDTIARTSRPVELLTLEPTL